MPRPPSACHGCGAPGRGNRAPLLECVACLQADAPRPAICCGACFEAHWVQHRDGLLSPTASPRSPSLPSPASMPRMGVGSPPSAGPGGPPGSPPSSHGGGFGSPPARSPFGLGRAHSGSLRPDGGGFGGGPPPPPGWAGVAGTPHGGGAGPPGAPPRREWGHYASPAAAGLR